MRELKKGSEPKVLEDNRASWLREYLANQDSNYRKTKYRHPDIKQALLSEAGSKCVYCESKIGHNTPGDTEHIVPTSADRNKHFDWENLTIACTECNRRKNDYHVVGKEFLSPYSDPVESQLKHIGPVVLWDPGDERSEITVRTLELHNNSRIELLSRKLEKIEEVMEGISRFESEQSEALKELIKLRLVDMTEACEEYSGMIMALLNEIELTRRWRTTN